MPKPPARRTAPAPRSAFHAQARRSYGARDRGPPRTLLLNKPFDVLCQFTREGERGCLADFVDVPEVYPAGRLDRDSEGLLVLTSDGALQHRIADPHHQMRKTYLAQVEGSPDATQIAALAAGPDLSDGPALPCEVKPVDEPEWLWPRTPPIRHRLNVPTAWLEIKLAEGRNRQVRRMTAAVGLPTLRLLRVAIGPWSLAGLLPGQWRELDSTELVPDEAAAAARAASVRTS